MAKPPVPAVIDLIDLGHKPMSAQKALRLHCLDCCGGSAHEVRYCAALRCPSWPFRLGRSPWRAPLKISDERRQELRERGIGKRN